MSILWICVAYVLGSVPFGLVFARNFCHIDPRQAGSGNVGATNIARLCGKPWGAATLACDILKGAVAVWVAMWLTDNPFVISLTALAAIMGHLYSCFLGFKGGKAVATSIGVLIPLVFYPLFLSCLVCIAVIWRSSYVSLGSLTLVTALPLLLLLSGSFSFLPLSLVVMGLVYWSHRENIQRLLTGTEKTWTKKG